MSVLIKGMEMPTSCWECHFGHGDTGICVVDFKSHGDWDDPKDCPLVPVPPHGRLIDADALTKWCHDMQSNEWNRKAAPYSWAYAYESFEDDIDNAPTIIPAEEGET